MMLQLAMVVPVLGSAPIYRSIRLWRPSTTGTLNLPYCHTAEVMRLAYPELHQPRQSVLHYYVPRAVLSKGSTLLKGSGRPQ